MKKRTSLYSCNVLSLGADSRHLWQFNTGGGKVSLAKELDGQPGQPIPSAGVRKDWRDLVQPKVNIAWLPAEHVFLRVAHLPAADANELRSMLELQLEKFSPLPLAQVVWSFEALPKTTDNLQSVIVVFAAREAVEKFLGKLEAQGYLADRLEVPAVHQLLATPVSADGVWIYPRLAEGRTSCLVAWWYGGVLRDVGLINLPPDASAAQVLQSHIGNMAWAGELEGWLTGPARWHVVADAETVAATAPLWPSEESVEVVQPSSPRTVAELSAKKSATGTAQVDLLPAEYGARYRQQFVDRLWMRALAAVVVLYLVGVGIYFGWMQVVQYQASGVAAEVRELSGSYTNALRLRALGDILQEQFNLRFAALDAWRLASEHLPDGMKLTSFTFSGGKRVGLFGEAPADAFDKLAAYNGALVKATLGTNSTPFFVKVSPPSSSARGNVIAWSFTCELNATEIQ